MLEQAYVGAHFFRDEPSFDIEPYVVSIEGKQADFLESLERKYGKIGHRLKDKIMYEWIGEYRSRLEGLLDQAVIEACDSTGLDQIMEMGIRQLNDWFLALAYEQAKAKWLRGY